MQLSEEESHIAWRQKQRLKLKYELLCLIFGGRYSAEEVFMNQMTLDAS